MSTTSRFRLSHPITLAPMEEHTNYPFRLLMKQHGASFVCTERIDAVDVHARSVAQAYVGGPDWTVVQRVKRAVAIPVLGSGGVREAGDAIRFLRETGADGVAIGRGCLGNPWIFRQARDLHHGLPPARPPTPAERGRALLQLVEGEFRYYGLQLALPLLPRTS